MNKTTRAKRNLFIAIAMMIVGMIVIWLGNQLFDYRMAGGYAELVYTSKYVQGILGILICIAETAVPLVGLALIAMGAIGIYNNTKKMR